MESDYNIQKKASRLDSWKYYHEEQRIFQCTYGRINLIYRSKFDPLFAQGAAKRDLFEALATRCSPGFNLETDLEKIAVVNQTTLLRNLTIEIIDYLRELSQKNMDKN